MAAPTPPLRSAEAAVTAGWPSDDPGGEFQLSRYLEPIQRRKSVVAVCAALAVLVGVVAYLISPPRYRATTVLQVERHIPGIGSAQQSWGWDPDYQAFYPTQKRLLQSRGLAERAVKDLKLAEDAEFNPGGKVTATAEGAPATQQEDAEALAGLARKLQVGLDVALVVDTQLIELSYEASTPRLAAKVANGVADAFIDWGIENRRESVGRTSEYLGSQIEALKGEIQEKEAQLQAYSLRTDIVNLDPTSNDTLQRLEDLNSQYTGAVSERIARESRFKEMESASDESVAESLPDVLLSQLRLEQYRLEREYATKLSVYKPDWPAMQQLAAQIEQGRKDLAKAAAEVVGKARDAARSDFQGALRKEVSLREELARQKGEALKLNSASVEYNNLKVEVSTRRALLDELLKRQSQVDTASQLKNTRVSNVVVVDRALAPGAPYRPSLRRNLQLGLLAGLLAGLALVFLLEHLDRTLKTPEDVNRVLGLPVLALLPDLAHKGSLLGYYGRDRAGKELAGAGIAGREAEAAVELLPHRQPRLAMSEAYRSLRASLLLSSADGLRALGVTSAVPGEGKTVTAVNLAVVLAQLDRKVLIVDGDLRRPRLHEILAVSNRVGLVSHLTGSPTIDDVVVATTIPGLSVVPAGPMPPNPSELLASERMRLFLEAARRQFDFVVVDTPPVLPVADALLLGARLDGMVLCLGARIVRREDAVASLQRLLQAEVKVLGAALNRYQVDWPYARYGRTEPSAGEDAAGHAAA